MNKDILKKFPNIIYDLDGTITKVLIDWTDHNIYKEQVFKNFDPNYDDSISSVVQQNKYYRLSKEIRDDILKYTEWYEEKYYQGNIPNTELVEFIKNNKNSNQFILTSQEKRLTSKLLTELGIINCFKKIISRNDVRCIKPDAEGLHLIIENNNHKDYVFVGDRDVDKVAAESMGIEFFLVEF